jgi:hypothetical protein
MGDGGEHSGISTETLAVIDKLEHKVYSPVKLKKCRKGPHGSLGGLFRFWPGGGSWTNRTGDWFAD